MRSLAIIGLLGFVGCVQAQTKPDPTAAEELASIARTMLLAAMPTPLVDQGQNWGQQRMVPNGIRWEREGLLLKPHTVEKLKNDGIWRKIRIDADNPEQNLMIQVSNVQKPGKGRMTFDMVASLKTNIKFEQQVWKSGVRLYSGETRARCRPILTLKCESITKVVKTKSLLPDVTFRMRVLDAKLTYDQFVVEHTLGVGGDAAKILGDAAHDLLNQIKPSIERKMLEKANQSIIKAGDTKEVKLGLGKLLDGK